MMTTHLTNLYVTVAMCLAVPGGSLAVAATPQAPAISEDARAAVAQMGKTLHRKEFSFRARTIRPYANENGAMLRIEHDFKVPVRRPDRMLIDANGDDGPVKLLYDSKTVALALDAAGSRYGAAGSRHHRDDDARCDGSLRARLSFGRLSHRRA